jgi:hypothetical protein
MAHYACLDENNIVFQVITGVEEGTDGIDWEEEYGKRMKCICKRTSYNTQGNVYYNSIDGEPDSDQSKSFRKNYAGIGFTYDENMDAFIPPRPYESWSLNEETGLWISPLPKPNDGFSYIWDEENKNWIRI